MVNDDGIDSINFRDFAKKLGPNVELVISAPASNYSGMSSALGDWRSALQVKQIPATGAAHAFSITASPVMAARFGLGKVEELYERKPDLLVSGPNDGTNWGNAARYSGTVGAAREGVGAGIPGLAISVDRDREPGMSDEALDLSWQVTRVLCQSKTDPMLINFNLPAKPEGGLAAIQIAPPDMHVVQMNFVPGENPDEVIAKLSWNEAATPESDVDWLRKNQAVITVLPMENEPASADQSIVQKILSQH
jgi:5'-nucleotidase